MPVLDRDKPLALEIEHAASSVERLAVEIYDSREPAGYIRLGLLSGAEGENVWHVDRFLIEPIDSGGSHLPKVVGEIDGSSPD